MVERLAWIAALSLLGGCLTEEPGHLAATDTGDLSHPLADRTPPAASLDEACGEARVTDYGTEALVRLPYLQQVDTRAADVVWTSAARIEGTRVVVTDARGEEVATVEAVVDTTAAPLLATQWVASIDGLEPSTTYCYSIEDDNGVAMDRIGFETAPASGAVRFLAFGDSGNGSVEQLALRDQMETVPYDFVLHVGDIAYEDGSLAMFEQNYFDVYAALIDHFSVFPVPGNHEYNTADAAAYREVFTLPNNERWYSFDWGDAHFVALDTERLGEEQSSFLEADLAANTKPWTVVYFHRPPYSSGEHGNNADVEDAFVPILERHRVDLVLAGHDHDYERIVPRNGVSYVVTGGGGGGTRAVSESDFTAFVQQVIHFSYVTIEGDRLLLHAIDGTGREFDQLVIEK